MLIDSHAHLTKESLQEELDSLLERASNIGVEAIINIATHPDELIRGLALSEKSQKIAIYNAASTTPHDVEKEGAEFFETFAKFAREKKLIAIGETGLDYHYFKETAHLQQTYFRKYIHLAQECSLPLVIHCREAFDDFFKIIDEEKAPKGVLHCFTGTLEDAKKLVDRNWYVSLSGMVTFKKSEELKKVAKEIPLESILIETDTPYLAPHPYRGKQNEPSFLIETAKCIAELRNISLTEVAQKTSQNTRTLFRLPLI